MANPSTKGEFTGRHMAIIMVAGFGIVASVNFYMASLATGGFHGVVVENSYVASQKFNTWLEEARQDEALGWSAAVARSGDGYVTLQTDRIPALASVTAELRRPIGEKEFASLTFVRGEDGTYRSTEQVNPGRWLVRLSIAAGEQRWDSESELR